MKIIYSMYRADEISVHQSYFTYEISESSMGYLRHINFVVFLQRHENCPSYQNVDKNNNHQYYQRHPVHHYLLGSKC